MDIKKFNRTEYPQIEAGVDDGSGELKPILSLDDVKVGKSYEVIGEDNWRFKVVEIALHRIGITYTFKGGRRTMTLDKNESHHLHLYEV